MIHGREVRANGHVINVGIGVGGAEGRVDKFAIVAGEGNTPGGEMLLEGSELAGGKVVAQTAGAAMGKKGDMVVAEAEGLGGGARRIVVLNGNDLAFSEVVTAAVAAELAEFVFEVAEGLALK